MDTYSDGPDMFGQNFSDPNKTFRAVLSDPFLVEKIAMIRLASKLGPHLRGDGKTAGPSVISYGLPMLFKVQISHPHTRYFEELAGISIPKKTLGVKFTPPSESSIAEAMERIHREATANFLNVSEIPFEKIKS